MTIDDLIDRVSTYIINPIIALMFALALIYFLWGGVKLIQNADNDTEREKGKQALFWGTIGMFIMVAVGGIVAIIQNTIDSLG
jgi:hypothetical protein